MSKRKGDGAGWIRAQAQAHAENRRKDLEAQQATQKSQAEKVSQAFAQLAQACQTQQLRLGRLAGFAADQTVRIVEYRAQWRTEWERAEGLAAQLAAALPLLAEKLEGAPVWIYTPEHPEGVWAAMTPSEEGVLQLPALTDTVPVVPLVGPNGEVAEGYPDKGTTTKPRKRPAKKAVRRNGVDPVAE